MGWISGACETFQANMLPITKRYPPLGPPKPIEVMDDPVVLRRVIDGLRTLDQPGMQPADRSAPDPPPMETGIPVR